MPCRWSRGSSCGALSPVGTVSAAKRAWGGRAGRGATPPLCSSASQARGPWCCLPGQPEDSRREVSLPPCNHSFIPQMSAQVPTGGRVDRRGTGDARPETAVCGARMVGAGHEASRPRGVQQVSTHTNYGRVNIGSSTVTNGLLCWGPLILGGDATGVVVVRGQKGSLRSFPAASLRTKTTLKRVHV